MRSITGWRFLLVIALPIFLASLGVLTLTFDLLDRVSSNADQAEYKRNRDLIVQALKSNEADLAKLTRDNAVWDDAVANTVPVVDRDWFFSTWGHFSSIGSSYDIVAVLKPGVGRPEAIASRSGATTTDVAAYLGAAFGVMEERISTRSEVFPVASSLAMSPDGPVIAALANISAPASNEQSGKQLLMIRLVTPEILQAIGKDFMVAGLSLAAADSSGSTVQLHNAAGKPAFKLRWEDSRLGESMTGWARQKASAVLGFLIIVMTGISVVCWRLIQTLVSREREARYAALHDTLTELPNRSALVERIRDLRAAKNHDFAVAFADLDGFKEVNDSFGHGVGDRLIRAVGAGISKLAGQSELFCRMGGDEFVVLFSGEQAERKACEYAQNLIRFLVQPFDMEGRIMAVGASVGIAATNGQDLDELEILRRADIAMYRAKADGKNRSCTYDVAFDTERNENLAVANELRQIIASNTLEVVFQPIMDARTSRIAGVEALCRWPSSSPRQVTPDRFVAVAESSGLIDDLGESVLTKACVAAAAWPNLKLAVNISAVQLNNPRFVERSLAIIEAHGIKPNTIEFEITETSLIRDADRAKQVFKQLQLAGIKVALDDFGTGFSSIGYLRTFQFDRIKIDKSIISRLLTSPAELAIVQGTLLVARGLSAEVTAEGVERKEEVDILKLAGCTGLQGFYFHKPMSGAAIGQLLAAARQTEIRRTA